MVKIVKISSLVVCLLISHLNPANSQDIAALQLSEDDFFTDFPVVLTATRLQQPQKDSPIATTIIDRKMIEASGFTEIADLMRLAPGMLVNYDGNQPVVGYPFLYHKFTVRMQVLVDGRSVYTPIFGEMPWTQLGITIDDIERIEILRGPSSSSYGPNAMTGVISIITRHASLDKGAKVKVNVGKNGLREEFIRYGNKSGKFDYKVSIGNRQSEGFDERNDDTRISIFNFRGDYQVTQKDNFIFHITYNKGEFDQEEGVNPDWNNPLHDRDILHQEQHVKWAHTFENNNELIVQYYHQKRVDNNSYLTAPVPLTAETFDIAGDIIFVNENVITERQNLEIAHTLYGEDYSVSYGAIIREDMTEAPQYLYQSDVDTVSTEQFFINTEYRVNQKNIINAGIMHDHSDTSDTTTSPRISFNHHLTDNQTIRISYAKSTRSPFIFEEYTNYVVPGYTTPPGHPLYPLRPGWVDAVDLDPEELSSKEIGYIGLFNNKSTEIDLRYYESTLEDIVNISPDVAASIIAGGLFFDNTDSINMSGFEASISQKYKNSRLRFNFAHTNIVGKTAIAYDQYEAGAPKESASLLAMHDFSDTLSGSLGFYYTGGFKQLGSGNHQDSRRRWDIRLAKDIKIKQYKAKLAVILQNITDEKIETDLNNNIERSGYISFSMEL